MNTIEIKNLNKSYKNFRLKDINLKLAQGTVTGLIGENGAGKTTLIKCILDIIKYDGDIKIFGKKLDIDSKEKIGVVLNEGFLTESLKLNQVVFLKQLIKIGIVNILIV